MGSSTRRAGRSPALARTGVGIVAVASAAFYLSVFTLLSEAERHAVLLYFGWAGSTQLAVAAFAVALGCAVVTVACLGSAFISRRSRDAWSDASAVFLGGTLLAGAILGMIVVCVYAALTASTRYFLFASPDGATTVMVTEDDWGHGDITEHLWGPVYTVEGSYATDDFYPVLTDGKYTVAWTKSAYTLTYQLDWDKPHTETACIHISRRGTQ